MPPEKRGAGRQRGDERRCQATYLTSLTPNDAVLIGQGGLNRAEICAEIREVKRNRKVIP